ncbi:hypothetical protein TNCV_2968111 [Trichonephila clavipes]|nr:hypothetical protein TNCV_2968111 [Trichonephila clavipes]
MANCPGSGKRGQRPKGTLSMRRTIRWAGKTGRREKRKEEEGEREKKKKGVFEKTRTGRFRKRRGESRSLFRHAEQESKNENKKNALRTDRQAVKRATQTGIQYWLGTETINFLN